MLIRTEQPNEKLCLFFIRPVLSTWAIGGPSWQVLAGSTITTDVILRVTMTVLTPPSFLPRLVVSQRSVGLLAFVWTSGGRGDDVG